jgi:glycosyltransferase involved in cell wall biosynthesis
MKVVFDCERMKYPNTGIYHYCFHVATALSKIFLRNPENQLGVYLTKKLHGIFGNSIFYKAQSSVNKFYMPATGGIDIWHVTYQHSNYMPAKGKYKIVLTVHDINFMHEPGKSAQKKNKYMRGLDARMKKADAVIFISKFVLEDVTRHIPIRTGQLSKVIYNGCNISGSVAAAAPQTQPGKPFIFTIGTILPKKNFHVLPQLLVNNDRLLIIGGIVQDENYLQHIKEEAIKYGVQDRVLFTNAISEEEKYWYLQNCESFVFPSLMEGFGLPVIEAMYFGKPVFLSRCTALPEIGGDAAYYFDSFDADHMQDVYKKGMEDYFSTPVRNQKIKERALLFNWDNTARQYYQLYEELCKK